MMIFRTKIETPHYDFKIESSDKLFFLGSCFATNISSKCHQEWGLSCLSNPYGVTYNTLSVTKILKNIENQIFPTKQMITQCGEQWCSLMHHSDFNTYTEKELMENIALINKNAYDFMKKSNFIFITLGTAWVYERTIDGEIVNNCHKLPATDFDRRRLSVTEIVEAFTDLINSSQLLKNKRIIFTVSPIRHIRDGLAENTLSKSTLIVAVHELIARFNNIHYFPAYEIVMDDLRDYRFYADDMTHPSSMAIDYVSNCFSNALFSKKTQQYTQSVSKLAAAYSHRTINPNSEAHKKFKINMLKQCNELLKTYPDADLDRFITYFSED